MLGGLPGCTDRRVRTGTANPPSPYSVAASEILIRVCCPFSSSEGLAIDVVGSLRQHADARITNEPKGLPGSGRSGRSKCRDTKRSEVILRLSEAGAIRTGQPVGESLMPPTPGES